MTDVFRAGFDRNAFARCAAIAGLLALGVVPAVAADRVLTVSATAYGRSIDPAAHGGALSDGPGCAVAAYRADKGALWLAHFTGGNVGPQGPVPGGLDWKDVYACFPSRKDCDKWQGRMRSAFSMIEGYRACVVIR